MEWSALNRDTSADREFTKSWAGIKISGKVQVQARYFVLHEIFTYIRVGRDPSIWRVCVGAVLRPSELTRPVTCFTSCICEIFVENKMDKTVNDIKLKIS